MTRYCSQADEGSSWTSKLTTCAHNMYLQMTHDAKDKVGKIQYNLACITEQIKVCARFETVESWEQVSSGSGLLDSGFLRYLIVVIIKKIIWHSIVLKKPIYNRQYVFMLVCLIRGTAGDLSCLCLWVVAWRASEWLVMVRQVVGTDWMFLSFSPRAAVATCAAQCRVN